MHFVTGEALKRVLEDPSTASMYISDPEIGPVILQAHSILQSKE